MTNVAWRLKEHVAKRLKESVEEFKGKNEDALPYKIIPNLMVVRKVPKEVLDQPYALVRNFLESKVFQSYTNEKIMEVVASRVAPYVLPSSFMDKPLSAKQLKAIGGMMTTAGLAFDPKTQKSLSKIKLAIKAGKAASAAELTFTGAITFGPDFVTVGSKRYPISDANGYKRIKIGSQKLRVDVLQAFLEAGNLPSSTL